MAAVPERAPAGVAVVEAMAPSPWAVRRVKRETHDTMTLAIESAEGGGRYGFAPGQFNMLYVFGVGEAAISISGDPGAPQELVHTVRAVGRVTNDICRLRRGQTLGVRGPFGSAWPVDAAVGSDVLIVAGGIGLAPLRPVLYHVLAHRSEYGRVALVYGARTPGDLLYGPELARWRGRFDVQVEATVDAADPDAWHGHVGVVTTLIGRVECEPAETTAMVCGPEVMMRFTVAELEKRGLAPERIYLSMERSMRCAVGLCGHCQFGPEFVCKDGPVFRYDRIASWLRVREL